MTTGYHPYFQYAHCHSPLYCQIDKDILDLAGWSSFDISDGCIDAPDALPVGSAHGSDAHGSCIFKDFIWREYTKEEDLRRNKLAKKLIDEVLAELKKEDLSCK